MVRKQCSVLIIDCAGRQTPHRAALERRGFRVDDTAEWPPDEAILRYEVVIVVLTRMETVCMLAARIRAKPRFGHRVLIGVASQRSDQERRNAIVAGFDDVVEESCDARVLVARVLRRLRARPEFRCLLPDRRRPAA